MFRGSVLFLNISKQTKPSFTQSLTSDLKPINRRTVQQRTDESMERLKRWKNRRHTIRPLVQFSLN